MVHLLSIYMPKIYHGDQKKWEKTMYVITSSTFSFNVQVSRVLMNARLIFKRYHDGSKYTLSKCNLHYYPFEFF